MTWILKYWKPLAIAALLAAVVGGEYGYSQKQVLQFVEATNNAMRVGGVGAQEQAAALFQLSQALGSGRLQGDEFRSISEAAPILLDTLAEHLGKTRKEILAMASDGKLTSDVIVEAVTAAGDKLAEQAEGMKIRLGDALTVTALPCSSSFSFTFHYSIKKRHPPQAPVHFRASGNIKAVLIPSNHRELKRPPAPKGNNKKPLRCLEWFYRLSATPCRYAGNNFTSLHD